MKVISWNCRGFWSKKKEEAMRILSMAENPDIMLVQETKLEENEFLQRSKKFWNKGGTLAVSARGASRGLGTLWNSSKLRLTAKKEHAHWLFTKLQHQESMETFSLFNVYVPVSSKEKETCWESLRNMAEEEDLENILIAGDLNITLSHEEKCGGCIVRDPTLEWVEELIHEWDLIDLKSCHGKFNWSNKRAGPGHISTRLDRFLIQSSYFLLGLDAMMIILTSSSNFR